mgnify:CR=1 FL=1
MDPNKLDLVVKGLGLTGFFLPPPFNFVAFGLSALIKIVLVVKEEHP